MRLFVALKPSGKFRTALSVMQDRLREAGVTGRFLDPSNLHLTLAFIGDWAENISGILPPVEQPFSLALSRSGTFSKAKVLWAGVEPSEELDRLARRIRNSLSDAGIPFDPQPFVPHITLARKPVIPEGLDLAGIGVPRAEMTVTDVFLYRSDRGENGMVYSVIGRGGERPDHEREKDAPNETGAEVNVPMTNSIRIADTTREERERIVAESIGNLSGLCDGCSPGMIEMYQDYIDGKKELREINAEFRAGYMSGASGPDRTGCGLAE